MYKFNQENRYFWRKYKISLIQEILLHFWSWRFDQNILRGFYKLTTGSKSTSPYICPKVTSYSVSLRISLVVFLEFSSILLNKTRSINSNSIIFICCFDVWLWIWYIFGTVSLCILPYLNDFIWEWFKKMKSFNISG